MGKGIFLGVFLFCFLFSIFPDSLSASRKSTSDCHLQPAFPILKQPMRRNSIRQITNFERTQEELEAFLIFAIAVAGKNANPVTKNVERFLGNTRRPFEMLRRRIARGRLERSIRDSGIGKWGTFEIAIPQLVNSGWDLRTVTVEQLETIEGISHKTSRFFILHSREGVRVAALDRMVIRWMNKQPHLVRKMKTAGYVPSAEPPSSDRKYKFYEDLFLEEADRLGRDLAEMDYQIWLEERSGEAPEVEGSK